MVLGMYGVYGRSGIYVYGMVCMVCMVGMVCMACMYGICMYGTMHGM